MDDDDNDNDRASSRGLPGPACLDALRRQADYYCAPTPLQLLFQAQLFLDEMLEARGYAMRPPPHTWDTFRALASDSSGQDTRLKLSCMVSRLALPPDAPPDTWPGPDRLAVLWLPNTSLRTLETVLLVYEALAATEAGASAEADADADADAAARKPPYGLLLITEKDLTHNSRALVEDAQVRGMAIEVKSQGQLLYNPLRHHTVPRMRRLTRGEAQTVMKALQVRMDQLPRQPRNQDIAAWLGLEEGDVVEIRRPAETAGFSFAYRIVA